MSDSESQSTANTKYRYAVVWFETEKMTELVPLSWVYNKEGQDFCFYPPRKEYKHIDTWLTSCAKPKTNWESFIVEILSRTKSLEKGKQRLERSYKTKDIESTDGEAPSPAKEDLENTPVILSKKAIEKNLKSVPAMFSSKCVPHQNSKKDGIDNSTDPLATNRITCQHPKESNAANNLTEEYLDEKLRQLALSISANMTSMKRSLLYDFQTKTDEIKNALIVEINHAKVPVLNCTEARAGVGVALPIKNLDDFITFDEALNE
ncbi:hypothetical protein PV328_012296, partial [Microctonus aethiopoides]